MFYPGTLWSKRIKHLVVLSTITLNLYVMRIQDRIIELSNELASKAESISTPAEYAAIAADYSIAPVLSFMESIGAKDTTYLASGKLEQHITNAYSYSDRVGEIQTALNDAGFVLGILNWIWWLPIAFSVFWLVQDLKYGTYSKTIFVACLCSALINYYIFYQLLL
jgi:hypothetical protein